LETASSVCIQFSCSSQNRPFIQNPSEEVCRQYPTPLVLIFQLEGDHIQSIGYVVTKDACDILHMADALIYHGNLNPLSLKGFLPGIGFTGEILPKMDPGHQHEGYQANPVKPGRFYPIKGMIHAGVSFHHAQKYTVTVMLTQDGFQGRVCSPGRVVSAVAYKDEGLVCLPGEKGGQGICHSRIIFLGGEQGQAHGRPDRGLVPLCDQSVKFMAADQVQGLDHHPFIPLLSKRSGRFNGIFQFLFIIHGVPDHSGGIGPMERMIRKSLPEDAVHSIIGGKCPGSGAKGRKNDGNIIF